MAKLVELSKKHAFLGVWIQTFCYVTLGAISLWIELCGWLRTYGIGMKKFRKIRDIKDSHSGQRCFIIATGPSLTIADLELLRNEITFGMNSIIKKYGEMSFRPTYYGIQDHLVYQAMNQEILNAYEGADNVFISDRIARRMKTDKCWRVFPWNVAYHAWLRWFRNRFFCKFSDDCSRIVYDGYTVTYSLIQLAVYMGFSEIYLLGADCSYSNPARLHFAEHGVRDTTLDTAAERQIVAYEVAKAYAKSHNVKIYNATRGGNLEMFQRVNLEDVLCSL